MKYEKNPPSFAAGPMGESDNAPSASDENVNLPWFPSRFVTFVLALGLRWGERFMPKITVFLYAKYGGIAPLLGGWAD